MQCVYSTNVHVQWANAPRSEIVRSKSHWPWLPISFHATSKNTRKISKELQIKSREREIRLPGHEHYYCSGNSIKTSRKSWKIPEENLVVNTCMPSTPLIPTPISASCIMPTSLAPSPIPRVVLPVPSLTSFVICKTNPQKWVCLCNQQ